MVGGAEVAEVGAAEEVAFAYGGAEPRIVLGWPAAGDD